jgi:hypothetical protein
MKPYCVLRAFSDKAQLMPAGCQQLDQPDVENWNGGCFKLLLRLLKLSMLSMQANQQHKHNPNMCQGLQ